MGDTVIFQSQFRDLTAMGLETGIMTADPERTRSRYPGVRCFDVKKGRLRAMAAAAAWSDVVVVGGGELVQDSSSLLYSPFNLLPLFLARLLGKKSFAWAVGIGQGSELRRSTRMLTRLAARTADGITVRDRGSFNALHHLGLREPEMLLASDCALSLEPEKCSKENLIGAAPRDVSNRTGHLLPLELRRKLGAKANSNPEAGAMAWARLLDWCSQRYAADIVLLPFHTGSLSNDDGAFCRMVADRMKRSGGVSISDPGDTAGFLNTIARCRVMVTTPLHGAILAFAAGTVPVSVSYSSKCLRFMEQAGLQEYVSSGTPGVPDRNTAGAIERAWKGSDQLRLRMEERAEQLRSRAKRTPEHFRKTFGL